MDAQHLHITIMNRREDQIESYTWCLAILDSARALPGQENDPGEKEGYDLAVKIGDAIKAMVWDHARKYGLTEDAGTDDLAAVFFATSLGHISTELLGALFYTTTRERYQG
jgi:hypothetical protein